MANSMFGKGLIAFFSLYFSNYWMRFIKIVHCVTGIEGLWLLLLFAAAFIRFSCYCQKYLKGHAIYHWFLYPLSSVFWIICHVQNVFSWSKQSKLLITLSLILRNEFHLSWLASLGIKFKTFASLWLAIHSKLTS